MAGNQGWVKNWRQIEEWQWYTTSNMAHLFQHLIRQANHEDKKWQNILIKRGQVVTGSLELANQLGIGRQSVRTCFERLKSTNEITIKSTNKYSVITICNYDSYQDKNVLINQQTNQQPNQQLTNNQPTTNHKQEYKNVKNDKKSTSPPTPLSIHPTIGDVENECFKQAMTDQEAERIFAHYNKKGWVDGAGQPLTDLASTITAWRLNPKRQTEQQSKRETIHEQAERLRKAGEL